MGELVLLIDAAYTGPAVLGISGPERGLLYRMAVETGLRASELRSLTRFSFDLEGEYPTVTVEAAYSKRRRADTLPLRTELAGDLKDHLAAMTPAAPVFKMPRPDDVAKMLRADLDAVGIAYRDAAGRVADFHSLRHSFLTNLASGGVHPKVAQALARHSTITLTMDRYTHTCPGELSAALAALPDLSGSAREAARATGTDDAVPAGKNLASCLAQNSQRGAPPVGAVRPAGAMRDTVDKGKKPRHGCEKRTSDARIGEGGIRTRGTGLNPYDGLANRWFQPLTHLS